MIAIIAPARNVRLGAAAPLATTKPLFPQKVDALVQQLRDYSPWQLESLLDVPPERAFALYDTYAAFDTTAPGTPALLAYYGAAYRNMAPQVFTTEEWRFAQKHLRILSALYGMLRPLDGVLQHRLGLKKNFSPNGENLHAFWGNSLYQELYKTGDVVVNLASVEYAKLITPHMQAGDEMLACRFLVDKPGGARATVSTVRAARGLMTRFIIQNGINRPQDLKAFDLDGYRFVPGRSGAAEYVFVKQRL